MKPLRRKWARVSLVLHYLGWGLFVVVSLIFGELLERTSTFRPSALGCSALGWC